MPMPRLQPRPPMPDWKTSAAAAIGSVGGAVASAFLVNSKVLTEETTSAFMTGTGVLGAFLTGGNARVAFAGLGSAGAGQLALATMAKAALHAQAKNDNQIPAAPAAPPPQLPAAQPADVQPRRSASSGGYVVDLFRDASRDLDGRDDAWRYGDAEEYVAVDLDEAA
jgi:hypothetical protein